MRGTRELGLNRERYIALVVKRGWIRHEDQARGLGISQATVSRTLAGIQRPGSAFVVALIEAFPEAKFEDLFKVVDGDSQVAA